MGVVDWVVAGNGESVEPVEFGSDENDDCIIRRVLRSPGNRRVIRRHDARNRYLCSMIGHGVAVNIAAISYRRTKESNANDVLLLCRLHVCAVQSFE